MLPFSREEFFAVFAAYNTTVWPAQSVLYLLAFGLVALALSGRRRGTAWDPIGLALLWAWTGVLYHWWHFTAINPLAWGFGALFLVQAVLFAASGAVGRRLAIGRPRGWRGRVGGLLMLYALIVYPLLGLAEHPPSEVPVLGVPCPTTIFTVGLLFWSIGPVPRQLLVIPLAWALIGSSAIFVLGVWQDLGLLVAGLLGLVLLFRPAPPEDR